TAYRSFGGEVEESSTPTICRLPDSRRHQLSAIAPVLDLTTDPESDDQHAREHYRTPSEQELPGERQPAPSPAEMLPEHWREIAHTRHTSDHNRSSISDHRQIFYRP